MYYWLIVNGGKIGPLPSEDAANAKYREIVATGVRILSAIMKVGTASAPDKLHYVIC